MREIKCQIFLEFSKTVANLPDEKCPGPKPATTEICYAGLCDTREPRDGRPISISFNGVDRNANKVNIRACEVLFIS